MFWVRRDFSGGFFPFFFFERTQPAASIRPPCLIYLSTSTGVRTGFRYLISLSVCVCVCVTFNSSFLLIARAVRGRFRQKPVSTEAGEYGLTRETWFFARRLDVVVVAGLMCVSWCVFGGAGFFLVLQVTTFSNAYIQSSQRRLGEGAPTAS